LKKYKDIISIIENEIDSVDRNIIDYINDIFLPKELSIFLLKKSKKIRSSFAILFIKAKYGKISDKQLKILALTEMIHNASLIHDDIIDEAKTRRNEPAINILFGNNSAVIIGDYILSLVLKKLINFENTKLTNLFINSLYEICKGEFEQDLNKNKFPTIEEYIKKSERKTSELFKTALIGALLSENQQDNIVFAEKIAENFGIMFQVKNDLIDFLEKKSDNCGKNDAENGIFTAPLIYLNENNTQIDVKKDSKQFINAVKKTEDLIHYYGRKTLDLISSFPDNIYKNALINLCMEVQKGKND